MQHEIEILCRYRLERAKEDLQAARVNHCSGLFKASINRSYYAIFHSIRAVNILDGFDASKHSYSKYYSERSECNAKNIGKKFGISIATVKRIMRNLQKSGKIQREDSRRNSLWVIINSKE